MIWNGQEFLDTQYCTVHRYYRFYHESSKELNLVDIPRLQIVCVSIENVQVWKFVISRQTFPTFCRFALKHTKNISRSKKGVIQDFFKYNNGFGSEISVLMIYDFCLKNPTFFFIKCRRIPPFSKPRIWIKKDIAFSCF